MNVPIEVPSDVIVTLIGVLGGVVSHAQPEIAEQPAASQLAC